MLDRHSCHCRHHHHDDDNDNDDKSTTTSNPPPTPVGRVGVCVARNRNWNPSLYRYTMCSIVVWIADTCARVIRVRVCALIRKNASMSVCRACHGARVLPGSLHRRSPLTSDPATDKQTCACRVCVCRAPLCATYVYYGTCVRVHVIAVGHARL